MNPHNPNLGELQPKNKQGRTYIDLDNGAMDIDPKKFGRRIAERRNEFGWSQAELGKESGFSSSNIGFWERGECKHPEKVAHLVAIPLETTAEWLLTGHGYRGGPPSILTEKRLVALYRAMTLEEKRRISNEAMRAKKSA